MNAHGTFHLPSHGAEWQSLGELDLPSEAEVPDVLYPWLARILSPLQLQADLLHKILTSVQNAADRTTGAEKKAWLEHIHLSVFSQDKQVSKGKSWGYFHVERLEDPTAGSSVRSRAIDLYLYMEGT